MLDDRLVREQAFLDNKSYWFYIVKATTHDFGQKLQIFLLSLFGQNGP